MPTQLLFTRFLNEHFASPVTGLLRALHIKPLYPQAPITNAFAMELLIFFALLAYFALVTFLYYHYHGVRANGFAYIKQFLGPVWWLYPLLLPIEIISHCARVLSLTVRLYANMLAGDLLTLAFFSLVPIGIPLVFLGLHFGVAIIQAYVFMLLAMIYLSLAVAHDH